MNFLCSKYTSCDPEMYHSIKLNKSQNALLDSVLQHPKHKTMTSFAKTGQEKQQEATVNEFKPTMPEKNPMCDQVEPATFPVVLPLQKQLNSIPGEGPAAYGDAATWQAIASVARAKLAKDAIASL